MAKTPIQPPIDLENLQKRITFVREVSEKAGVMGRVCLTVEEAEAVAVEIELARLHEAKRKRTKRSVS